MQRCEWFLFWYTHRRECGHTHKRECAARYEENDQRGDHKELCQQLSKESDQVSKEIKYIIEGNEGSMYEELITPYNGHLNKYKGTLCAE